MTADLHVCASGPAVPFLDALTLEQPGPGAPRVPEAVRRWMVERDAIAQDAGAGVENALQRLADGLGSALLDWIERGEGGDVRGRVLAMSLDDALTIIDDVNDGELPILAEAREQWAGELRKLADMALTNTAEAAGLPLTGLDVEGWTAVQRGALENAASAWDTNIRRVLGDALLRSSSEAVYATPDAVRQRIVDMVTDLTPQMVTEARTATAAYDRIISNTIADEVDPEGDTFLWVYSGPVDGLQRPFCVGATGLAFTRAQVAMLRNKTPGMPVADFGGGYNCRHQWLHMLPGQADRAGFRRATAADIALINAPSMQKGRK